MKKNVSSNKRKSFSFKDSLRTLFSLAAILIALPLLIFFAQQKQTYQQSAQTVPSPVCLGSCPTSAPNQAGPSGGAMQNGNNPNAAQPSTAPCANTTVTVQAWGHSHSRGQSWSHSGSGGGGSSSYQGLFQKILALLKQLLSGGSWQQSGQNQGGQQAGQNQGGQGQQGGQNQGGQNQGGQQAAPNTNPCPNNNGNANNGNAGRNTNNNAGNNQNQQQNNGQQPTIAPTQAAGNAPTIATNAGGNTSTAYVAAGSDNCGNSGYTNYINQTPPKKNFGDPKCDFTKDKLYTLLKQLDPKYADEWYLTIAPGESGYDPNAFAPPTGVQAGLDNQGAWGLFQMSSSNPEEAAPPAPPHGGGSVYNRGDVNWQVQASNAVNYNVKVLKCAFTYWATARSIWNKQSC